MRRPSNRRFFVTNLLYSLEEHPHVQAFNNASVDFGRSMKPHDLLNEAISQRKRMIEKLKMVLEAIQKGILSKYLKGI
ncbi:hypothetical protein [Paenibacillus kribbensis]|uniref:hypothetical protein n=1 Tax=Paenibacillus kribbensis TaxID=172713 RepID=UPI00210A73BF|nr:hypothetical protein [Paenibacillus kribbensis]